MQELAGDHRPVSRALTAGLLALALGVGAHASGGESSEVDFPTADGGEIHALVYGDGDHAVVLAHGAVFDKESWEPLARPLADSGLRVLAIDFRGYGRSRGGSAGEARYLDVLAAISYLQAAGSPRVSVVGASMGGGAAARAAVEAASGTIDQLILLAPVAIRQPENIRASRVVYVSAQGDPSLARTREQYQRAPEPKRLELVPGDAHAQHLFKTDQAQTLVDLLVELLRD